MEKEGGIGVVGLAWIALIILKAMGHLSWGWLTILLFPVWCPLAIGLAAIILTLGVGLAVLFIILSVALVLTLFGVKL